MAWQALFGEKATTKLAAFFDTREQLETVSAELRRVGDFQNPQLWVVHPHDSGFDRKLEPETQGVARTAVRAHLVLGALGLVAGVILWGVMYALGLPAIVSSPFYSGGVILAFSIVGGMLLGGLVTARPDHQTVIRGVEKATQAGRWSLVLHPRDEAQCKSAEEVLTSAHVEMVRTI